MEIQLVWNNISLNDFVDYNFRTFTYKTKRTLRIY